MTKPLTLTKNSSDTILSTGKRAINQATINNSTVQVHDGNQSILVYPNDTLKNVLKSLKKLELLKKIAFIETA